MWLGSWEIKCVNVNIANWLNIEYVDIKFTSIYLLELSMMLQKA